MQAFLVVLREKYDGAEGYCKKIGFTEDDIALIKKNLKGGAA